MMKRVIESEFDIERCQNEFSQLPFEFLLSLPLKEEKQRQSKSKKMDILNTHCIDYLGWSTTEKRSLKRVEWEDILGVTYFSFLLAADHGLELGTRFFIQSYHDAENQVFGNIASVPLRQFNTPNVIVNSSPTVMQHRIGPPEVDDATPNLRILKCLESEDRYELNVSLRGFTINSLNGI